MFLLLSAGSSSLIKNYSCEKSHGNCVLNNVILETESDLEQVEFPDITDPLTIATGKIPHFTRMLIDKLPGIKDLTINRLEVETVYVKPEMTHLEAVGNQIRLLEVDNDKDKAYQMLTLDLSSNNLEDLSVLSRFRQLRRLTLNGNKFDTLSMDLFEGMSELRQLSLDNNNMYRFDTSKKIHLPKLQTFSLAGNGLIELHVTMWDFPSLKELDVSNNKLHFLEGSLDQFKSLESVKISGNYWKCDFVDAILLKTIKLDEDEPNRCKESNLIDVQRICCTYDAFSILSIAKDDLGLFDDKWEDLRNLQKDFQGFKDETERKLVRIGELGEERSLIERIEEIKSNQEQILERLDSSAGMLEIEQLRSDITDHKSTMDDKYSVLGWQLDSFVEPFNELRSDVNEKLAKYEEIPEKLLRLEQLINDQGALQKSTIVLQKAVQDMEKQQLLYHLSIAALRNQIGSQVSELKAEIDKFTKRNEKLDTQIDRIMFNVNTIFEMLESISED